MSLALSASLLLFVAVLSGWAMCRLLDGLFGSAGRPPE